MEIVVLRICDENKFDVRSSPSPSVSFSSHHLPPKDGGNEEGEAALRCSERGRHCLRVLQSTTLNPLLSTFHQPLAPRHRSKLCQSSLSLRDHTQVSLRPSTAQHSTALQRIKEIGVGGKEELASEG